MQLKDKFIFGAPEFCSTFVAYSQYAFSWFCQRPLRSEQSEKHFVVINHNSFQEQEFSKHKYKRTLT